MRSAIKFAGVVLLIAALVWLGLETGRGAGHVPAVWWANAALVSILLLDATDEPSPSSARSRYLLHRAWRLLSGAPRKNWPALLAAGYAANVVAHLLFGDPLSQALSLSGCDIGETAIAAYGVGFASRERVDLTRQRQLLQFLGFAVLLGPLAASVTAGLVLHSLVGSSMGVSVRWFPPDALGMSVIPPVVQGLARKETWALFRPGRLLNTVVYLALIAVGTSLIFSRSEFTLLFLIIPPLLLLVLRLGLSGGALGCVLIAVIGTDFTVGPQSGPRLRLDPSREHRILLLQMFLATAVLSVSVVGVVLAELRRAGRDVRESELRYRSIAASMEMLASIDPLTRVANRRRFEEVLQNEWQRCIRSRLPVSLVLIDADLFKDYNDHYGHVAGDECLRRIAEKMGEMARRPADLIARFGGEEFGMVLPETCAEGALACAERLRQSIADLGVSHPSSPSGLVTVSGGCATMIPAPLSSPVELVHAADAALYEAKRRGRNRVETLVLRQSLARTD